MATAAEKGASAFDDDGGSRGKSRGSVFGSVVGGMRSPRKTKKLGQQEILGDDDEGAL